MAESDVPPAETNDPAFLAQPPAKPVAPAPRANLANVNAKEAPPAGGPPGFSDFLEWMRSQSGGETTPSAAGQRELIPKERKKFQRRDADAKADLTGTLPATKEAVGSTAPSLPSLDAPSRPAPSAAPEVEGTAPAKAIPLTGDLPPQRVRRQQAAVKRNSWLGVLAQLGVLVLLAASFLIGRYSASKVPATPVTAPAAPETVNGEGKLTTNILSDTNAALIDQAMAAEQDNDFKKATDLLGKVKASGQHVPGLVFQLAQLAVFEGDFNRALPMLNDSLALGENLGDVYNMRATLASRRAVARGNGMNDFELAAKVAPFDAHNFFFWGEALRRTGKDQAAIVRLQGAIDRLREPVLESLYRLKLRLAKIEAGQEKDFAVELAAQLALPNPEMDWLITAAALEMHGGRFAAAATYLDRASLRGDTEMFSTRLRDYYLYQFKYEKELARFYPRPVADKSSDADKPAGDSSNLDLPIPQAENTGHPLSPPVSSPAATPVP